MESQGEKNSLTENETEAEKQQIEKVEDNQQQEIVKGSTTSSSTSSSSDVEEVCENENLAENLKEALAERERNMQLQKQTEDLSNSKTIEIESKIEEVELPPPLPPKTREKKQLTKTVQSSLNEISSQISDDDADRVLDFTSDKYSRKKLTKKRSDSTKRGRTNTSPLLKRPALVSLHPSTNQPTAYDPLKLVDTDDDDINTLVKQANNLEMREYQAQDPNSVEVLYPSYQIQSAPEKKPSKSAIPDVFNKIAQPSDLLEKVHSQKNDSDDFEAIRSPTIPSTTKGSKKSRRHASLNDEVWPSDITDFDSLSDGEMPQEENEDDLYAYDTVADQTDAEIAGIGSASTDGKIVCDKYVLYENNLDTGKTFPRRNKLPKKSRSGIPDSIAIPLSDLQTGNRRLVTSQSILGYPSTQKGTKSKRIDSLETKGKQVQPPPLITAVKHISPPEQYLDDEEEEEENKVLPLPPADRVLEFPLEGPYEDISQAGNKENSEVNTQQVLEQQQIILEQLQKLNSLQTQQAQTENSNNPVPSAPPLFGTIEPIVVTTHIDKTEPVEIELENLEKENVIVEIENPLAGKSLGGSEQKEEHTTVELQTGKDSGIDLPIFSRNSNTSSDSDTVSQESETEFQKLKKKIEREKEYKRIKNWYEKTYLKPRCCFSCVGAFVFCINFVFFLISLGVLGLAGYGLYGLLLNRIPTTTVAIIDPMFCLSLIGFVIFVITLTGMVGFCKGKLFAIKMFGVLLISLCYIFMIGSIVFWVYKEVFPKHLSELVFKPMIKRYHTGNYSEISGFTLDQIQQNFECCGIYEKKDWELNEKFACKNDTCTIPNSCCIDMDCSFKDVEFPKSCMDAMSYFVDNNIGAIAATWGAIMLVVTFQFICMFYMIREVKFRGVIKRQIKLLLSEYTMFHQIDKKSKKQKKKKANI